MGKQELQFKHKSGSKGIGLKTILFLIFSITILGFYYLRPNAGSQKKIQHIDEISDLANQYQLNNQTGINKHLSLTPADFQYWMGQQLTKSELILQFEARKTILDLAHKKNRKIINQEDLAYEAEILIIGKLAQKYGLDNIKIHPPHLILDKGDFAYWKNKNLSLQEIEKRFKIMNQILQNAKKNNTSINNKSELGYLVEKQLKE